MASTYVRIGEVFALRELHRIHLTLYTWSCASLCTNSVTQSCTLPYRRFVIGRASRHSTALEQSSVGRMQFRDTAAARQIENLR
jgi:hypothetical protein